MILLLLDFIIECSNSYKGFKVLHSERDIYLNSQAVFEENDN